MYLYIIINKKQILYTLSELHIGKVDRFILCTMRSGGTAHEDQSISQLDQLSLTPLSAAGCGRLQLGVPNWAVSVDYRK